MAATLLEHGHGTDRVANLTGVPAALLDLIRQEQLRRPTTQDRAPRRLRVTAIVLGVLASFYLAVAPALLQPDPTADAVGTGLTIVVLLTLLIVVGRRPRPTAPRRIASQRGARPSTRRPGGKAARAARRALRHIASRR